MSSLLRALKLTRTTFSLLVTYNINLILKVQPFISETSASVEVIVPGQGGTVNRSL